MLLHFWSFTKFYFHFDDINIANCDVAKIQTRTTSHYIAHLFVNQVFIFSLQICSILTRPIKWHIDLSNQTMQNSSHLFLISVKTTRGLMSYGKRHYLSFPSHLRKFSYSKCVSHSFNTLQNIKGKEDKVPKWNR